MNHKFTDVDNSSPVVDLLDRQKKVYPRSKFDFSNSKILQAQFGAIIPIDCINTLPNEDYTIGYDILALTRNPAVRRVLSGCRLYVHTFYQPESNLWEGALNQKTGGRSGNIQLEKPYLKYYVTAKVNNTSVFLDFRTPSSLCDYLGLPIVRYDDSEGSKPLLSFVPTDANSSQVNPNYTCKVDALRFVMYQRFCRDMMFNSNLLYNNKEFYPDNEYHFILPYSAEAVFSLSYSNPSAVPASLFYDYSNQETFASSKYFVPENNSDTPLLLGALRFRQFRGDVFTSALPFPDLIRGDAPVLDFQAINALSDNDLVTSVQGTVSVGNSYLDDYDPKYATFADVPNGSGDKGFSLPFYSQTGGAGYNLVNAFRVKVSDIASKLVGQNVSLADLRALMVYTLIKQKNALTSGDYNDLIKAHFGVSPRVRNFQHTYIGGFYADMVYNEVFQTSASDTSPLGTTASRGVTAQSGYIGKFHSDDYGYIMTCLEIVPEVYYHQGLDRNLTKLTRDEVYLPETNELSPQAILNQEIYASADESYNKDVFGYTERNIEYKYRKNEVHGLSAVGSHAEYDNALLQKRTFNDKVYLNNDFVTMSPKNIDMSIFSFTDEPPFDVVVKSRIEKVSPIPYVSIPGGLDLSLT